MAVEITTSEAFLAAVGETDSAVAVHFWASWAPQCVQMNEVFDELAKLHPFVRFLKVQAEELPEISEKYDIAAVPTFILLKGGAVVERVNGANAPELTKKLEILSQSLSTTITAKPLPQQPSAEESINSRLKKLINAAPVMLFMKGSPAEPKCGFSKKIVQILKDVGAEFSSFDIFTDETVRQGLKTLSNWPTYPQLYINGELVGGLDIVDEMARNGELKAALPQPSTKTQLEEKLKKLINQSKVMVFIKGTPQAPRCGFSEQIIQILRSDGVNFDYFDILGDSEVREGLKVYSNWPTFPQLYVNGELLGGLDIIKEMRASGEFLAAVNA